MFRDIFLDELTRRLRSLPPWIMIIVLVGYTVAALMGADTPELGGGGVPHNGSFVIYYWGMYAGFWVAVLGPLLMAGPLLRDVRSGMAPLVYAAPISDAAYFWGKYAASMTVTALVQTSVPATIVVTPWIAHALGGGHMFVHETLWGHLAWSTIVWILPACFVYGSVHFALAARTGRQLPGYAFAVLSMAVFTMFFVSFETSAANRFWIELVDPMGKQTLDGQALLWSVPERTTRGLAATPVLIANRLMYLGLGAVALAWGAAGFRLHRLLARAHSTPKREKGDRRAIGAGVPIGGAFGLALNIALVQARATFRSSIFRVILAALVMIAITSAWGASATYTLPENQMLPYAQQLFPVVQPALYLMLAMTMVYFGGELAARDRDSRMAPLIAATSASNMTLVGGRWIAILLLALPLCLVPSLSILIFQAVNGFIEPELQHFVRSVLLHLLPQLAIFGTLCLAIDLLTRSRLAAQGIPMVLLWAGIAMHEINVVHERLVLLGTPQPMLFSAFAVLDSDVQRYLLYTGWWMGLVTAMMIVAAWFNGRGETAGIVSRLRAIRPGVAGLASVAALLLVAIACAIAIKHDLNDVVRDETPEQERAEQAAYEQRYRAWADKPRPLIEATTAKVWLDPAAGALDIEGVWTVRNPGPQPISDLLVNVPEGASLELKGGPLAPHLVIDDAQLRAQIYRVQTLAPGETALLSYRLRNRWRGFADDAYAWKVGRDTMVVDRAAFPRLNYDRTRELAASAWRLAHGLGERHWPQREDGRLAIDDSAGRVAIDVEVTAPDAYMLFAGGKPGATAVSDGRRIAHFTAAQSPLDPLIVASRDLVASVVSWTSPHGKPVTARFLHHRSHDRAVQAMADHAREVLDHLSDRFGEPPFDDVTLVETAQFIEGEDPMDATGSGGLIVIPERRGWLHDVSRPAAHDYLVFVLGREIGRAWWRTRALAPAGPGAPAVDQGTPIALGLEAVAARRGEHAAQNYATTLREQLAREIARSDLPPAATPETSTDQPYAGLQAGLAQFDAARRPQRREP